MFLPPALGRISYTALMSAKRAGKQGVARALPVGDLAVRTGLADAPLTPRQLIAVADAFALAAACVVETRLARRGELKDPEARTLALCEDRLARTVAWLRVSELGFSGGSGEQIARQIAAVVNRAVLALRAAPDVPRVVELARLLAGFADAALTRDAGRVAAVARKLQVLSRPRRVAPKPL